MASDITNDEIKIAKKFRDSLILETNTSLTKGIVAVFPTTPFSAPLCGQNDDNLGFLPDYHAVIIDEAHNLTQAAYHQLTSTLDQNSMLYF